MKEELKDSELDDISGGVVVFSEADLVDEAKKLAVKAKKLGYSLDDLLNKLKSNLAPAKKNLLLNDETKLETFSDYVKKEYENII